MQIPVLRGDRVRTPLPTANYAFADALLLLKDRGLVWEAERLMLRWPDVEIPKEAGIARSETI